MSPARKSNLRPGASSWKAAREVLQQIDRLLILFLATQAVRYQTREVRFGSGAELLVEWGMPTNGAHYNRLVDAFRRVFGSTIFFGTTEERSKSEVWHCSRTHFVDSIKLWLSDSGENLTRRDNAVTFDVPRYSQPVMIEDFKTSANSLGVR